MTKTKSGRVTIIARSDLTGLGVQSRNWVRLLNPSKVVLIDSTPFNKNEQHPDWYKGMNVLPIYGFISESQIDSVLDDTDVLLTFEIPYNYNLFRRARERGVKTILQNNWEFTDYLQRDNLPMPDLLVNHSYWGLDKQKELWPDISEYCPTPTFSDDYTRIRIENFRRSFNGEKKRFLHIAGRKTYEDRNGTRDLLESIVLIHEGVDFELVIKTQTSQVEEIDDPRVTYDYDPPTDEKDLYYGFDAMILPRRYAGASLPMNEALTAGLPVIMTDIEPNNKILPNYWLVGAEKKTEFMARTMIDVYSADHIELAGRIAQFAVADHQLMLGYKNEAVKIAYKEYSDDAVKQKWSLLLEKLGVQ